MSAATTTPIATWGLLAQFDSPGALLRATRETCKAGYRQLDVYTPFPVHGMDQAMGMGRSKLGWIIAAGAYGRVSHRGGPAVLRGVGLPAGASGQAVLRLAALYDRLL